MSKLELYYPVKKPDYICGQKFGENAIDVYAKMGLKGHNGLDLYAPDGFPIYAAHDGEVVFCGEDGSAGLGIVIRTLEPKEYKHATNSPLSGEDVFYKSIYWHIKKGSFKVKAGDKVKAGQLIAEADNTGMSTGSHLHFGIKPVAKGEADWSWYNVEQANGFMGAIDPAPFFNGFFAEDAQKVQSILQKAIDLLVEFLVNAKK